jgi:hypothetical protein
MQALPSHVDTFVAEVNNRLPRSEFPTADAGGPYAATPCLPSPIELDASGSSDSNGFIALYEWDLEDDGIYDVVSEEDPTVSVIVEAQSTQQIHLRVTDDSGNQSEATAILDVNVPEGAILGTESRDTIRGTKGDDIIIGFGGNDVIIGREGNDLLLGCDGNDRLLGNAGSDYLNGGRGDDKLLGGKDNDVLEAGPADKRGDRLDGGRGTDECSDARRVRKCEAALSSP